MLWALGGANQARRSQFTLGSGHGPSGDGTAQRENPRRRRLCACDPARFDVAHKSPSSAALSISRRWLCWAKRPPPLA